MAQALSDQHDDRRALLDRLRLFAGVPTAEVNDLLRRCDRRDLATGEVLLSPGHPNEHVYVVLSGLLSVHVGDLSTQPVAIMESGSCVGEMSIIESRDPSAYVVAAEPSHLLAIHKTILWQMVDASHAFAKNLLIVLSERVRSHNRVIAKSYGELRRIERHATTDALTGLGNRHSMQADFPRRIRDCLAKGRPAALIMIDVDNFKPFNDRFGHIAGDRALKAVADTLKQTFRPDDMIVRYGGDEFAVLLPGADGDAATIIADRVRRAVTGRTDKSDDSLIRIPLRISMGVADLDEAGDLDGLIRAADAALYRAKHSGRDNVSL